MIECPACHGSVTEEIFLSACSDFWPEVRVVYFTCPLCGDRTEARLEHSRISLGYIYAAGAPHFCGMVDVEVEGLTVSSGGRELEAELDGQKWVIGARE